MMFTGKGVLHDLQQERVLERDMWDFIRELLVFAVFMWIVFVLAYASRSTLSNVYTVELRDHYLGNAKLLEPEFNKAS